MFRAKLILLLVVMFSVFLVSCALGAQYALPDGVTLVPGTDIPQQVATIVSSAFTQTAIPATATLINGVATLPIDDTATFTPIPIVATTVESGSSAQTFYQSSDLGIQFSYPSTWYLQELPGSVILTSFEPSNPPHKLEWKYETTSMEFGFKVFIISPPFDDWVEDAKLEAQAEGWEISMEESFLIANRPAVRLSLVSGSGGILNRVLIYELSGRYFEINIEGNYNNNFARTVLNTIQPYSSMVVTAPPPIVSYENSVVGYRLNLPGDWNIDESGMTNGTNKEVIFSPPYSTESFIIFLSISLDFRTLDQIINFYAQSVPDAIYEATMLDNGKTFNMKVGDKLRLNLDGSYNWSGVSVSDPNVIGGVQDFF